MAWLLGCPFVFIAAMLLFLPVIGLRVRDLLAARGRPVLAGAGMMVAVALVRILLESGISRSREWARFAGGVTYNTLTRFINNRGYREIVGLIKG